MSTVYIAASSQEIERVCQAARVLTKAGVRTTTEWWHELDRFGFANPVDQTIRLSRSRRDLLELEAADVLWVMVPPLGAHSHRAFTELGFALALGKRIISSGPTLRSTFCSLTSEFSCDDGAIEYLTRGFVPTKKMARGTQAG